MTINSSLKQYIEREILPLYLHFDKAHSSDHAEQVIEQSLKLAEHYDVDIDMVYTIAAYHDTGLCKGREHHHTVSAEIVGADSTLRQFFTPAQIATIQEAVIDHRASSKHEPRTIYGRIVAEADRCIDPITVIRRTIQYGLKHYPEMSKEQHAERCLEHLIEKYGREGYLKLWIPHSDNATKLEQLRVLIDNREQLMDIFDTIYEQQRQ